MPHGWLGGRQGLAGGCFHPSAPLQPERISGGAHIDHRSDFFCPSNRAYLPHSHILSSSHIDPIQSQTSSLQARSRVLNHIFLRHRFPWIMSASSHDPNWGDCKPCSRAARTAILTYQRLHSKESKHKPWIFGFESRGEKKFLISSFYFFLFP